jgi:hypothetical protein
MREESFGWGRSLSFPVFREGRAGFCFGKVSASFHYPALPEVREREESVLPCAAA